MVDGINTNGIPMFFLFKEIHTFKKDNENHKFCPFLEIS